MATNLSLGSTPTTGDGDVSPAKPVRANLLRHVMNRLWLLSTASEMLSASSSHFLWWLINENKPGKSRRDVIDEGLVRNNASLMRWRTDGGSTWKAKFIFGWVLFYRVNGSVTFVSLKLGHHGSPSSPDVVYSTFGETSILTRWQKQLIL